MSKYAKDDCRFTKEANRPKQLFSPYPKPIKDSIFEGNNRKERRGIGARFRKVYGKSAFAIMRKNIKEGVTVEKIVNAWIHATVKGNAAQSAYSKAILGY